MPQVVSSSMMSVEEEESWITSETDTNWEEKVEEIKKEKEQPRKKTEAEKKGKG